MLTEKNIIEVEDVYSICVLLLILNQACGERVDRRDCECVNLCTTKIRIT